MLHGNLTYQIAHTDSLWPYQYFLAIFRYPYQVDLQIVFRVRAFSVPSHATILHEFSLRLKARGFPWVYDKNMGRFDRSFYLAYNLNA
jgi:hypothetical protein